MDVVLVEADGVELHGHVRTKPSTEHQYFIELSLVSGAETIVVSSVVDETDAWMAMSHDDHTAACRGIDEAVQFDIATYVAIAIAGM